MTTTIAGRITLALGAFALLACAPGAMVNRQTEEQAIRSLNGEWQDAVNAHDIDRIAALYAPDVVLFASNAPAVAGTPALRKVFFDMLSLPNVRLLSAPGRVDVTSPTTATETGGYTLSFTSPAGRITDSGNYVVNWRKIDGAWRIEREAVVSTTPMPLGEMIAMDAIGMEVLNTASLTWTALVAPGYASGVERAVVHGNPAGDGDYTIRLRFPDGYQVPVHWHLKGEHVTVISGTYNIAIGSVRDDTQLRAYRPGDFIYIPARAPHYATTRGVTTVQLHGIGPFEMNLGAGP